MADGTSIDGNNNRVAAPPPPPPPPPALDATRQAQLRGQEISGEASANELRGRQAQDALGTRGARSIDPPMPGEATGPTRALARTPTAAAAQQRQEQQQAEQQQQEQGSALSRFAGGLWQGAKAGVIGMYEGGKALVTDPIGTAKAAGAAIGRGADAAADYGQRLVTEPGKTLSETGDYLKQKANDVANANAEDWGKAIGEFGVGAVGGYGAGKALQGLKAARALSAATPDLPAAKPAAKPAATPIDRTPDAAEPQARAPTVAAERAGGERDLLRAPKQTAPIGNQKITDAGLHAQGGLTRAEGHAINKFRDQVNAHNDKFGLNRDLPPTAASASDVAKATRQAKQTSIGNLHAEIRRTDEAVNKHLRPDDLAGRLKEQRGVSTGFDHVQETTAAHKNLRESVARIDKFLADNPNLPEAQARYLLDRRNGHADLSRTLETHLGFPR